MFDFSYREPSGEGWEYPADPVYETCCDDCGRECDYVDVFELTSGKRCCSTCAGKTHYWCDDCNEYHKNDVACPYSGETMEEK